MVPSTVTAANNPFTSRPFCIGARLRSASSAWLAESSVSARAATARSREFPALRRPRRPQPAAPPRARRSHRPASPHRRRARAPLLPRRPARRACASPALSAARRSWLRSSASTTNSCSDTRRSAWITASIAASTSSFAAACSALERGEREVDHRQVIGEAEAVRQRRRGARARGDCSARGSPASWLLHRRFRLREEQRDQHRAAPARGRAAPRAAPAGIAASRRDA